MQAGTAVQLKSVTGSWIIIHQELRQQHYGIKPQRSSGDLAASWARFAKCRNLDIISQFAWNQILNSPIQPVLRLDAFVIMSENLILGKPELETREPGPGTSCSSVIYYWEYTRFGVGLDHFIGLGWKINDKKTKKTTQQQMYQWLPWKGGVVGSNELCFFLLLLFGTCRLWNCSDVIICNKQCIFKIN